MAISLKLYVAGKTGIGSTAERNLAAMVEDLRSKVEFEIIDVLEQPAVAVQERILATPALVRTSPPPRRKVIGDLSDKKLVMISLRLDGPLDADKPKWVPKETCHE